MHRQIRTASVVTLAFTVVALLVALSGDTEQRQIEWTLSWIAPFPATILLMGFLFLGGLLARSDRELAAMSNQRRSQAMILLLVAALLVVGAVLGLVSCLLALLQDGSGWHLWAVLGLIVATVITDNAWLLAGGVLGGVLWGIVGSVFGFGQEPVELSNMTLVGLLVGAVVGAIARGIVGRGPHKP